MFVKCFAFAHIDGDVVVFAVFADELAFVHLFAGIDEELAAILQILQRETRYLAGFAGDLHARSATAEIAAVFAEFSERMMQDRFALRRRQQFVSQADQAAAGAFEFQMAMALVLRHVFHHAAARAEQFDDFAHERFRHVDGDRFDRLQQLVVLVRFMITCGLLICSS